RPRANPHSAWTGRGGVAARLVRAVVDAAAGAELAAGQDGIRVRVAGAPAAFVRFPIGRAALEAAVADRVPPRAADDMFLRGDGRRRRLAPRILAGRLAAAAGLA